MILKYAIALIVVILLAAVLAWAFLPARHLPGNRARHLRVRLHLRLHPGKGFAHLFSLWLRWGRLAMLLRSGRIRAVLPLWYRITGGVASTFCWDPVAGCEDPATAIRRADAFAFAVSQKGVEDGTFWSAKASDYLRGYFHAAALARYDLRAVAAWVSGADPDAPERILAAAGAQQWAYTLAELRGEAHKTAAKFREW